MSESKKVLDDPMKPLDNQRLLELATDIVITAMQTGRLDAGDAQAVAGFYREVAEQMCEVAFMDLQDLAAEKIKRKNVSP